MKLGERVIAATVTLPKGEKGEIDGAWHQASDSRCVILFGASDLLQITSDVENFQESTRRKDGRTVNTYHATVLRDVHKCSRPGLFRALSFLRTHRPDYEQLTATRLGQLLAKFRRICRHYNVECRALLGYGWADLYLELGSDLLDPLFAAIVGCRSVRIDPGGPGVFQNAFTIFGVDTRRETDAAASTERVSPQISLRVTPGELRHFIDHELPFPDEDWNVTVTSGKRDIFLVPRQPVAFNDFWFAHHMVREQIGQKDFPVRKMETHFDFPPAHVLPVPVETSTTPLHCKCAEAGEKVVQWFRQAADACQLMEHGLRNSFAGLERLYLDALDGESCCDFDAPAAHFFSQRQILWNYQKLHAKAARAARAAEYPEEFEEEELRELTDPAVLLGIRRRLALLRDAIERLEVSSVFIFNQEQNGSYSDLLSRSERVSLYRGGMQKLNTALLIAIDHLIDDVIRSSPKFSDPVFQVTPMFCWWPAGQIQSERPTGVIKVPVFYLQQPEVALFLIMHELGQLVSYEYDQLRLEENLISTVEFTAFDAALMAENKIGSGMLPAIESLGDAGKFITDLRADIFLLRVGFANDIAQWRDFVLEQFLDSIASEHALSDLYPRGIQFMARLIAIELAAHRADGPRPITDKDRQEATLEAAAYLTREVQTGRLAPLLKEEKTIIAVLTDKASQNHASHLIQTNHEWIEDALLLMASMPTEPPAEPKAVEQIRQGHLTPIDTASITSYFRGVLQLRKTQNDTEDLSRARAALISSILGYCKRHPRLERELPPLVSLPGGGR